LVKFEIQVQAILVKFAIRIFEIGLNEISREENFANFLKINFMN
jgi:hypothetical protein